VNVPLPILTCDHCGACCMHIAAPPYTYDELVEMVDQHPDAYTELYPDLCTAIDRRDMTVAMGDTDEIPCGFFDEKSCQCKHYDHRPAICREFEPGCEPCQLAIIGRGRIVEYSTPWCNVRPKS
jgi:Fe-S-cluster containining protein